MFEASDRVTLTVNLDHLVSNYKKLIATSAPFHCPMIKADAYGHGAIKVGLTLVEAGAQCLGVMFFEEAIELREAGIQVPVIIYGGIDKFQVQACLAQDLVPVVSSWEQLNTIEAALQDRALSIHIKVDTGMHRLGFAPDEADALFEKLWKNKKIRLAGVLSHLSHGDDIDLPEGRSQEQLAKLNGFAKVFSSFKPVVHGLASAPLIKVQEQVELAHWGEKLGSRFGLALYGINPAGGGALHPELRPVMSMHSVLSAIRPLAQGECVSYGGTWCADKDTYVGVIPVGYADGLPRPASNKIQFRVNGKIRRQVGTICMDYCMIDLGPIKDEFRVGDRVTIFDDQHGTNIVDLAKASATIPYEIMTGLGRRVKTLYVKETNE